MNATLFTDDTSTAYDHQSTDARHSVGRFDSMQTRRENAYTDAVHTTYLRTHPRALARRQHAADGALCRRLAHEHGLTLGYGIRVDADGRLTRTYGAAMQVYWER